MERKKKIRKGKGKKKLKNENGTWLWFGTEEEIFGRGLSPIITENQWLFCSFFFSQDGLGDTALSSYTQSDFVYLFICIEVNFAHVMWIYAWNWIQRTERESGWIALFFKSSLSWDTKIDVRPITLFSFSFFNIIFIMLDSTWLYVNSRYWVPPTSTNSTNPFPTPGNWVGSDRQSNEQKTELNDNKDDRLLTYYFLANAY